ncbi:hypothetical protein [Sphingomonas sp. TZW2008]|uniref:hypothetical protein n=1 Tax=Sphingomonas sp. TZW2008 TaxID=1917973 RepID=UPI0011818E6E|nr:hypothetical protein [Sphingomonas sp. TZW2008]
MTARLGLAALAALVVAACSPAPPGRTEGMAGRPDAASLGRSAPLASANPADTSDRITSIERPSNSVEAAGRAGGVVAETDNVQENGERDAAAAVAVTQAYFGAIKRGDYRTA